MYRLLVLTRRSLTAATDAIGACCFNGGLYNLRVPSRDCHVASLLAMTNLKASCRRIIVPILAVANGAQGAPLQTQSVCAFLSLPCTSCKCLTPHFTRILRPAGGKNAALSGETPIFRMFCGQNGVQWAESLQKNNIAGKTDKRARNFSEQLKFLCNVV